MTATVSFKYDAESGALLEELHERDGKTHREPGEGPAHIRFTPTGRIESEEYHFHGELHREDGPAVTEYFTHQDAAPGAVRQNYWYKWGRIHRDPKDGPADIEWTSTGIKAAETYYFMSNVYRNPKDGPYRICRDHRTGEIECEAYCEDPIPSFPTSWKPRIRFYRPDRAPE